MNILMSWEDGLAYADEIEARYYDEIEAECEEWLLENDEQPYWAWMDEMAEVKRWHV